MKQEYVEVILEILKQCKKNTRVIELLDISDEYYQEIIAAVEKEKEPWTEIRMRGKGALFFKDEYGRPTTLRGKILVNFHSEYQDIYVKVQANQKEYLLPFSSIVYIEWDSHD